MAAEQKKSWKKGGCHCGAVKWEALTDDVVTAIDCNCSICRMTGAHHLIVPAENFQLLQGEGQLAEYKYNTGIARHLFCKKCGVKSYYHPRSNPEGISLDVRCMDQNQFESVIMQSFDGQNWEDNASRLSHLSKKS